jgi:molybdenum cofactor cytidylyltransferase
MSIAVIILAGGSSTRLGSPKQLLSFNGSTLLQHAIDQAKGSGCEQIVVVLGSGAHEIFDEIDDPDLIILENAQWEEGMASSIRSGIYHVMDTGAEGAIIMVCDQPYADNTLLKRMLAVHRETGKAIVAAVYDGKPGTPALFNRAVFESLLLLRGDKGAKHMIMENKEIAAFVDFPGGITDIDTSEDYERLRQTKKE